VKLLSYLNEKSNSNLNNNTLIWNWLDSEAHTICVLFSLEISEIYKFNDIDIRVKWDATSTGFSFKGKSKFYNKKNDIENFKAMEINDYTKKFSLQKLGWLGGDGVISIPMPNEVGLELQSNKIVWVFADTYVGCSLANQFF
jgi:hypothetical protein